LKYNLERSYEILERTPRVFRELLSGIGEEWTTSNEGPDTFSPYDVIGHLIHGEKTDWVPRAKIILEHGVSKPFTPYDRFAQIEESRGKTLDQLLDEFQKMRTENLKWFGALTLSEVELDKKGMHPGLGEVSLRNLLVTWVVHDLTHIAQVGRVMAKQYREEMGPWPAYFRVLDF
jgi:DinB superfamily